MLLQSLRPILWTRELDETIRFYTAVLGFTVTERNEDWQWASLLKDNVSIMLAKPNAHTPFDGPRFTGSFYFNTSDVNALWEHLKDRARICYEPEDFEWEMREFGIFDNNGYLLQFGQDMSSAAGPDDKTG